MSLQSAWPLRWTDAGLFLLAFVLISAAWIGVGFLVTGPLDSSVGSLDRRIATSLADRRTDTWDRLSSWGSMSAETTTTIVITAAVAVIVLYRWRRWREPLLVAMALAMEASCSLAATLVVARRRPEVPHLDSSPVDSSFPSWHAATAMSYGAVAVVVFVSTRRVWPRVLSTVLTIAVVVVAGLARMYRGMHFLSDVTAGALLGLACLAATWFIVVRAHDRHLEQAIRTAFG